MTDDELERLRQQTERGSRLEESDEPDDFFLTLVDAFGKIEAGDLGKTLAFRDQPMAALFAALDEHDDDELVDVGQKLQRKLDRDVQDDFDKSEVLRLALRLGLEAAAPEYMEELRGAYSEHQESQEI
jgi:hypothetical protein